MYIESQFTRCIKSYVLRIWNASQFKKEFNSLRYRMEWSLSFTGKNMARHSGSRTLLLVSLVMSALSQSLKKFLFIWCYEPQMDSLHGNLLAPPVNWTWSVVWSVFDLTWAHLAHDTCCITPLNHHLELIFSQVKLMVPLLTAALWFPLLSLQPLYLLLNQVTDCMHTWMQIKALLCKLNSVR